MKLILDDPGTLVSTNVAETVAAWAVGTTYAQGAQVRSDTTHHIFESTQGSNIGHDPMTDDGTWWLDAGPTNPYAMFDESLNTVTSNADTIQFTRNPTGRVSTVAFFGLAAATLNLTMTDDIDGEVYNHDFGLVNYDNIGSYYDYFFQPVIRKTELVIDDLPLYSMPDVTVTIDNTGGTAECGNFVMGLKRELGATLWGASFGIIDSSRKETDDFGITTLVERSYRSTATLKVALDKSYVNETKRILAARRAIPTVFIGDDADYFSALQLYGFPKDWTATLEETNGNYLDIQLEGLA